LRRLLDDVAKDHSCYGESIQRQPKQIDHSLRIAANSTDWDDAETEGARRSRPALPSPRRRGTLGVPPWSVLRNTPAPILEQIPSPYSSP
jgi:hypothetical protein